MIPIIFGTDGWRGIMGEDFTDENVQRIARAFVVYLCQNSAQIPSTVAIGYDGRKNSRLYADLIADTLSQSGIDVLLSNEITPTPALSFATKFKNCSAGIMITASHNPPEYNGIKFKGSYGGPLMTEATKKIESLLDSRPQRFSGRQGVVQELNFLPEYRSHLLSLIDTKAIEQYAKNHWSQIGIMIDSMGGAGQTILEDILVDLGWRPQTIFGDPEPSFYDRSPEPIARNLEPLMYNVGATDAILGIATDGDADRCSIVYDNGEWVNAQEAILALLWHLHEQKGWTGTVVKTASVTDKVTQLVQDWNLMTYDVTVGFKYIAEQMLTSQVMFGGEESGGFGYGRHIPDRDGILSGLFFIEMLAMSGKSLREIISDIRKKVGELFYDRIDTRLDYQEGKNALKTIAAQPPSLLAKIPISGVQRFEELGTLTGLKLSAGICRWLLLRTSQTESLVRIYAEGNSSAEAAEFLQEGKRLFGF